jgi:hypothetical protein
MRWEWVLLAIVLTIFKLPPEAYSQYVELAAREPLPTHILKRPFPRIEEVYVH